MSHIYEGNCFDCGLEKPKSKKRCLICDQTVKSVQKLARKEKDKSRKLRNKSTNTKEKSSGLSDSTEYWWGV